MIADLPMDRLGLLFDALVAVLLVATIVYAVILERKLSVLRDSGKELDQLVGRFTEATAKAERVLADIRAAAGEAGQVLQSAIDQGNTVADDLMLLVERGGSLADRLDKAGRAVPKDCGPHQGLDKSGGAGMPAAGRPAPGKAASPEGDEQDSVLMKTLRGMR